MVAAIMVSAVAYVITFETPAPATTTSRDILEQKADDALRILYDTPVSSSLGDNMLSVLLLQCLQGDCAELTTRMGNLLPEGTSYAFYLSNGYQTFPVYVTREPGGETVTTSHLLEPSWSSNFLGTARNHVNATRDPLLVYSLPIFNSNPVSQGGSPLRVMVYGKRVSDNANYTLTGYFSTLAADADDAHTIPAATLSWLVPVRDDTHAATGWTTGSVGNWSMETVTQSGGSWEPTSTPVEMRLRLSETGNVTIPAGTQIVVDVPRGWSAEASANLNAADWTIIKDATNASASYADSFLRAELTHGLRNASVEFTFNATYHGDHLNVYHFRATMLSGALAEANLLAIADRRAEDTQTFRAPAVHLSVPRPMGAGNQTEWALGIDVPYLSTEISPQNPYGTSVSLSGAANALKEPLAHLDRSIVIQRIEITEMNGDAIFGTVAGTGRSHHEYFPDEGALGQTRYVTDAASTGTWTSEGNKLVWEGTLTNVEGPLGLRFNVTASGTAGSQASKNPFTPPLSFDDFKGRLVSQSAAGLYREAFLPQGQRDSNVPFYEGYSHPYNPKLSEALGQQLDGENYTFASQAVYKSTALPGTSSYSVDRGAALSDSLYGSYVTVETPSVPIGGQLVLTADVQSVLFALADAGQSAGVKMRIYPPWTGDDRTPILERPNLDTGLLESQVTQVELLDVNSDGFADPIIGTNNGRVIALDAITGIRITGRLHAVSVTEGSGGNSTTTSITHIQTIDVDGEPHIAVGTGTNSGIYVLDRDFVLKWYWDKPAAFETVAMFTQTDLTEDGQNELIAAVRDPLDATATYQVVVLKLDGASGPMSLYAPKGTPDGAGAVDPAKLIEGAFFVGTGEPGALMGFDLIGPTNDVPGVGVSIRTLPGNKQYTQATHMNVVEQNLLEETSDLSITIESPRHGFVGIDKNGTESYTFFGAPVTSVRPWEYDGAGATDVLAASSSGYVFALNGTIAAQPAYPVIYVGLLRILDAECADALNCALVSEDGTAERTRTGWNTRDCFCDPESGLGWDYTGATSITLNSTESYWMAGLDNRLWRTTPHPVNGKYPVLLQVELPEFSVEKLDPLTLLPSDLDLDATPLNFYDITFHRGAKKDVGWVVGADALYTADVPCTPIPGVLTCPESVLMRTTDGGVSWHAYSKAEGNLLDRDNDTVTATLTRINFTTDSLGWVTGTNGTLLRTLDGGDHWYGLDVPTTVPINDVACAPENPATCLVVAEQGVLLRTEDALAWEPTWTNLSAALGDSISTRSLMSISMIDEETIWMGATDRLLQSYDGGDSWTVIPMNYLQNDVNRVITFPDGTGYGFGGDESNSRVWYLHDYLPVARAQTVNLAPGLDSDDRIQNVSANLEILFAAGSSANVTASATGGTSWHAITSALSSSMVYRYPNGYPQPTTETSYRVAFDEADRGNDLRLRFELSTPGVMTHQSPVILAGHVNYTYIDGASGTPATQYVYLDGTTPEWRDDAETTADWNEALGAFRLPVTKEFWTRNVSGQVHDMRTGFDVIGDGRDDVWVATGSVLAANSPDYILYANSEGDVVGADNRVYLLDGRNGTISKNTDALDGEVRRISLSDNENDGVPDLLMAVTFNADTQVSYAYALDPVTLETIWSRALGVNEYSDMAGGFTTGTTPTMFVSTKTAANVEESAQSRVWGLTSPEGAILWSTLPDDRGKVQISETIPENWFFGPYVVEIVVEWSSTVTDVIDNEYVNRTIAESASFYDYFMVTPPDSLNPPSPVYNVHLVAWFRDWG